MTQSLRELVDVAGVLAAAGADLDRDYIERWVSALASKTSGLGADAE